MYFPNAFKKSYLLPSGTLALSTGATTALTAGQIGMYAPTSASNSTLASVSVVTIGGAVKPFQVVGGSYYTSDKIGSHGGYKETWKSKVINPKYISRVIKITAKSPVNQVVQVKAAKFVASNQTYRLRLDLKGSPALRFLNHQLYRTVDAYTGVVGTDIYRDANSALLGWKEQINGNPFLSQFIQARVLEKKTFFTASGAGTSGSTTQITIPTASTTGVYAGQRIVNNGGSGLPANSWVATVNANTSVVVKFPTQAATVATTAGTFDVYNDLYLASENGVSTSGAATYIPGTSISLSTVGAAAAVTAATAGAHILTQQSDASSQSAQTTMIELTCAYVDTVFGNATFTPTDKYELEPLVIYAAVVDELGNTNLSASFPVNSAAVSATNPYQSSHGIEAQAPVQASGSGESVLRDLILAGRYLQNAYPDSSRVDSLRMREIEADPMLSSVTRSALYDQVLVLHNIPRWNNPNGTFDNDQYLLQFFVPTGADVSALTTYFTTAANFAQNASAVTLETY